MLEKKILITGASGFIGSFIVEEALRQGFETWAAVRKGSSRKYLTDKRIHFIELNLADADGLKTRLAEHDFNYVVHAAGATKCLHADQFFSVNTAGTANLAGAARQACPSLSRFVFISSLSVCGPVREKRPYTEITANDEPRPDTAYGRSKLAAERALDGIEGLPFIVLRPTGVYGPREKDYFMMAQSISRHVDFAAGLRPQDLTFIYVKDLTKAIFDAIESGVSQKAYLIADEQPYTQREFRRIVKQELGKKFVIPITAPLWLVKTVCVISEKIAVARMKASTLNPDKYKILRQRNWTCDTSEARRDFGFTIRYDLRKGLHEAIEWYKTHNML